MKPRPVGHGSFAPAHGYCERPPSCWPGCSGSQVNSETAGSSDSHGARARVLVGLKRGVDAEVRAADVVGRTLGSFGQACAAVVELDRDRPPGPAATDGWNWSVGDQRIDVVVDHDRRRPGEAAVGGLRELHVHLAPERIPVLVREVEMARIGRARGEALHDPVCGSAYSVSPPVGMRHGRDGHERAEAAAVIDRSGDVDRREPPFGGNETTET